jgi:hypothetical protein
MFCIVLKKFEYDWYVHGWIKAKMEVEFGALCQDHAS